MTNQIRETISLEGKEYQMEFWSDLPKHPRIINRKNWPPDQSIYDYKGDQVLDSLLLSSTACWRGYQGLWAINNSMLFLMGLEGKFELIGDKPLMATWYSGTFDVLVEYSDCSFRASRVKRITVEAGKVLGIREGDPEELDYADKMNDKNWLFKWFIELLSNRNRF